MRSAHVQHSRHRVADDNSTRTVHLSTERAASPRLVELASCIGDITVPSGGSDGMTAEPTTMIVAHDPARDDARALAAKVNATLASGVDVVVVCDRHARPWRRLLVPYTFGKNDPAAFALARRLARRTQCDLMLLHVDEPDSHQVPVTVRTVDGCVVRIVRGGDPIMIAEREAANGYDVLLIGGAAPQPECYSTRRLQCLLDRTAASLVIVHSAADAATFDPVWF